METLFMDSYKGVNGRGGAGASLSCIQALVSMGHPAASLNAEH